MEQPADWESACPRCEGGGIVFLQWDHEEWERHVCPACLGSGYANTDRALGYRQAKDAEDAYNETLRQGGAFD